MAYSPLGNLKALCIPYWKEISSWRYYYTYILHIDYLRPLISNARLKNMCFFLLYICSRNMLECTSQRLLPVKKPLRLSPIILTIISNLELLCPIKVFVNILENSTGAFYTKIMRFASFFRVQMHSWNANVSWTLQFISSKRKAVWFWTILLNRSFSY